MHIATTLVSILSISKINILIGKQKVSNYQNKKYFDSKQNDSICLPI